MKRIFFALFVVAAIVVFAVRYGHAVLPIFWASATGYQARGPVTFAQLSSPYSATSQSGVPQTDGTFGYCSDCKVGANNVCIGGGTGSPFERINGVFTCGTINAGIIGSVPDPLSLNHLIGIGANPMITNMNTTSCIDPTTYGVTGSQQTVTCTAVAGNATLTGCTTADFAAGNGIFINNGGAAASINGVSPPLAPSAPTVGVAQVNTAIVPVTAPYTIAVANCDGVLRADLHINQRPFLLVNAGSEATGKFSEVDAAGTCTMTFAAGDAGKNVDAIFRMTTPPAGAVNYCFEEVLRDSTTANGGGTSPASAAACVTTAAIATPNYTTMLYAIPATVTGTYRYDFYESDNAGAYYAVDGIYACLNGEVEPCATTSHPRDFFVLRLHQAEDWFAEDTPALPPAASLNKNLNTTISTISGTTMTLAQAPGVSGTVTVRHDDTAAWAAMIAAYPSGNNVCMPGNSAGVSNLWGSRVTQIVVPAAGFHSWNFRGNGGAPNSQIVCYGDGGGWFEADTTTTTGCFVVEGSSTAGTELKDFLLYAPNSYLRGAITDANSGGFNSLNLRDMSITAAFLKHSGGAATRGINHTVGVYLKTSSGDWANVFVKKVDTGAMISGAVNSLTVHEPGSWNQNWPGRFLSSEFIYAGTDLATNVVGVTFEDNWNTFRPAGISTADSISGFNYQQSYNGDVATEAGLAIRGTYIHAEGSDVNISNASLGAPGTGSLCVYQGNNVANGSVKISNLNCSASDGVLSEIGAVNMFTVTDSHFQNIASNKTAIECRGGCFVKGVRILGTAGATGNTGIKIGYQGDEIACNAATYANVDYSAHWIGAASGPVATKLAKCATAELVSGSNDSGRYMIQATQPTIGDGGAGTCGTGTPAVAAGSNNRSLTFTTGTGSPTQCKVTFATPEQLGMTSTPRCTIVDQTASAAIPVYNVTYTAAPTATADIVFSAISTSHTYQMQCDNWY